MSAEIAISVQNVSKAYRIWRDPSARLKAPLWDVIGSLWPKKLRPISLTDSSSKKSPSYRDFYALKPTSFKVHKGETIGIIGRNGSGKSTLLQIIAKTLNPTSGSIITNGRVAALLELGSGFNPEFSGHENILLNASIMGLTRDETQKRYAQIVNFSEIHEFIHQPVKTYSSGMAVRLGFSVSIHTSPSILIIDEALAVGDIGFQQKCYSRLKRMKESGVSIIFVTHDISAVSQLCDKAIVMDTGEVVFNGNTQTAINEYKKLVTTRTQPTKKPVAEKSTFKYALSPNLHESGDLSVKIMDWRLTDEAGNFTNMLLFNGVYNIDITIAANKPDVNPNVGFFFSDVRGNEIAGTAINHNDLYIGKMKKNEKRTIKFRFKNQTKPGTYFLNLGCSEIINDNLQSLHRLYSLTLITFEGKTPIIGNTFLDSNITISQPQ